MSSNPEELYYTADHTWLRVNDEGIATVGITDFAQQELGDIVFVELPEVGSEVSAGHEISVIESVKTASDIQAPVSGEITAVNEALADSPEIINTFPYDKGWIFRIRLSNEDELEELLSAGDYADQTA
jgi:glycine cleavage system H protein